MVINLEETNELHKKLNSDHLASQIKLVIAKESLKSFEIKINKR